MIYRALKGTPFRVSAVAMGSALFGATYSEDFAREQLDIYVEHGGNIVDTAHVYNDWIPGEKSRSEKVIGRWLKSRGMAGKVIVLSKCAHPPMDNMAFSRVRAECVAQDMEESLENLGLDCLDLYLLHRDDPSVPIGGIVGWMNSWIGKGRIRYWGVSNWTLPRMRAANEYALTHGLQGITVNQTMWSFASIVKANLDDQTLVPLDKEAYSYHCETGMNLMAFTSQAKGYFARLAKGESLPESVQKPYATAVNEEKLAFLKQRCRETGIDIGALCLRFFDKHPFTAIPIVSYDTNALLLDGLRAYSDENTEKLAQIDYPILL